MSMETDRIEVVIAAQIGGLKATMAEAAAVVGDATKSMGASLASAAAQSRASLASMATSVEASGAKITASVEATSTKLSAMKGAFVAAGELMLVGFGAEKMIDLVQESAKVTVELQHLSEQTGINVEKLSELKGAANQANIGWDTVTKGLLKLSQTMVTAKQGSTQSIAVLDAMGISQANLTDKSFTLQDAFGKIADKLSTTKDGYEKAGIAREAFGRSGAELIPFLNEGSEGIQKLMDRTKEFGANLTGTQIAALHQYEASTDDVRLASEGLHNEFSAGLAPALTQMNEAFVASAKDGGTLHFAIEVLVEIFREFATVVEVAVTEIKVGLYEAEGVIRVVAVALGMLGNIIWDVLHLRFGQAKADFVAGLQSMGDEVVRTAQKISDEVQSTAKDIQGIWGFGDVPPPPKGSGAPNPDGEGDFDIKAPPKKEHEQSFQEEIDETIRNYTALYQLQAEAAQKGISVKELELEQRRQLGEISAQEEIKQLKDLENQKYDILLNELNQELGLYEDGTAKYNEIQTKILKLTEQHNLAMQKLTNQAVKDTIAGYERMMAPIAQAVQTSVMGIIQGTTTARKALANIFKSIADEFIASGVKMVTHWIAVELAKTTATKAANATRVASDTMAAEQSTLVTVGAAIKNIMAKAWEAAASVYASIAAIPYVGPFLAPVMAVAAGATIVSYVGRIASAAGGMNVDRDQLAMVHENEMILPADLSAGLRSLVANGGGGGGATFHIHALDAHSFERYLRTPAAAAALARTLRTQARNFAPVTTPLTGKL